MGEGLNSGARPNGECPGVVLVLGAGARRRGQVTVAVKCWWSLRRLWVVAISRHSVRAAARPRREKRVNRRVCFGGPENGFVGRFGLPVGAFSPFGGGAGAPEG